MTSIEEYSERLNDIVRDVCGKYELTAFGDFCDFRDFKVQWSLRPIKRDIQLRVSDYLIDAPDNVLYNLIESILTKQVSSVRDRVEEPIGYTEETIRWLTTSMKDKQELYLSRSHHVHDDKLNERMKYLRDEGLIDNDDIVAVYNPNAADDDIVRYSILFGVISVSKDVLDSLSDPCIDFILYSTHRFIKRMRSLFASPLASTVSLRDVANECKEEFQKHVYEESYPNVDLNDVIERFLV